MVVLSLLQASNVGKVWAGRVLQVTCVDPLADLYAELYKEAGVTPPLVPIALAGERLTSRSCPFFPRRRAPHLQVMPLAGERLTSRSCPFFRRCIATGATV
jgi:hypothetical protein